MVARTIPAPPTPWSSELAEPQIHSSAYVHAFSKLVGDVRVCANVLIAPGSSLRADQGAPFHIGADTNVQDGVVMHGLAEGRVLGDDGDRYSIWIGNRTSITHKALVHGPAYIGDDCFIGFRSTVFNARIGRGSVVMMHALIQDVEIPPGKYVPSGSIIVTQQQADRLPDVKPEDLHFTREVIGVNAALRSGYQCMADADCINPLRDELAQASSEQQTSNHSSSSSPDGTNLGLSMDIQQQVRHLLSQGYRISTEYADKRHFRAKSWTSGQSIDSTSLTKVLAELDASLQEHEGMYVRLLGIDPVAKRRVFEEIVQRPGDSPAPVSNGRSSGRQFSTSSSAVTPARGRSTSSGFGGGLTEAVRQTVRQLLSQGFRISTEHADKRRFRAKSWQDCGIIDSTSESGVISALDQCLQEHSGEYVRLLGVDTVAKRRVLETIIQRPGDGSATASGNGSSSGRSVNRSAASAGNYTSAGGGAIESLRQHVRQLLSQGFCIATEHADKRRFRAKSWQDCGIINSTNESGVMTALDECMREHSGEYVRMLGVDTKAKRRVLELIVQRPGDGTVSATSSPAGSSRRAGSSSASSFGSHQSTSLSSDVTQQIQQLLSQGYKIGMEYADKRRFRAKSWQSGPVVDSRSDAMGKLTDYMREHSNDYVKLLGIDTQSKRRVYEQIVQRPT